MQSEHLRYLTEIGRCRSISVAAQKLYISQASLSTVLKNVEEEIGCELFKRTHNGVQVTPEGEEALALIAEIEQSIEKMFRLREQVQLYSPPVVVVTSPTICSGLAIPLYDAFIDKEPTGTLAFHTISGEEVGTKLIKNEGRIGLTYFNAQTLESYKMIAEKYLITVEVLYKDHFRLLVSKKHPLARYDSIAYQDLENLHFACLPCYGRSNSTDLLSHPHLFSSSNHYTTFSDIALIKRAVLEQGMVAVLSNYAIQYNHSCDNSQLKSLRLDGFPAKNEMLLTLIHRCDRDLRYQEKVAIQCIKEHFESLPSAMESAEVR